MNAPASVKPALPNALAGVAGVVRGGGRAFPAFAALTAIYLLILACLLVEVTRG